MKLSRTLSTIAALCLLSVPASAQWQIRKNAVPIGRGLATTGFDFAAPGAAGTVLTSTGTVTLPTFQAPSFSGLVGQISASQIPNSVVTNSMLVNSSTTVNGQPCALGGSCVVASSLANVNNAQVLANTSGSPAAPIGTSASTWFDTAYCNTAGFLVARLAGVWTCSNAIPANVAWLGADPTGAAASDTAFSTACSSGSSVYLPKGTYKMAATATYSACRLWIFDDGAQVAPNGGVTLTLRGTTNDGYSRKFSGSGAVVGLKRARPEWWGAARNGTTDDTAAIKSAVASIAAATSSDGDKYRLQLSCGSYLFSSTLSFAVTQSILWDVEGCGPINAAGAGGTFLVADATFTGSIAVNFAASGDVFSNYKISNFILSAKTHNAGPLAGIQIGSTGGVLQSLTQSVVSDVVVQGFSFNYILNNVRQLALHRTASWPSDSIGAETTGSVGYTLQTSAGASSFVGDIDFWAGQVVGPMSGGLSGVGVSLNVANGIGIGGVRFHGFVFYGSAQQFLMQASGGANIFDVWLIDGCQFEGPPAATGNAIAGTASSPSSIGDFHVDHAYLSGSGYVNNIKFPAPGSFSSTGTYQHFFITNNFIANVNDASGGSGIDIRGTGGVAGFINVSGNEIRGIQNASNPAVYLENTARSVANGNIVASPSTTITYAVHFNGASGDYIVATGNNCGGYCSTGQATANGSAVAHFLGGNTLNLP